jgi:hypothetical protein
MTSISTPAIVCRPRSFSMRSGCAFACSNQFAGIRLAIDISGGGANNSDRPPDPVRDQTVERDITINGLPLNRLRANRHDPNAQPTDVYYRDHVIGGPGAFMVVANGAHDFVRAIRQKLLREIAARQDQAEYSAEWMLSLRDRGRDDGIVNLIDRQINPSNFLSESSCDAIETAPNKALHVN